MGLGGKLRGDLGVENGEVVGELQCAFAPRAETDLRLLLRAKSELVALDAELAKQLTQWSPLHAGRDIVGHCVQSDVILATAEAVKTVETARRVVALENADL